MKNVSSSYPVLCTGHGKTLSQFFIGTLGFETVFESDWYWHLTHPHNDINLALVDASHDSIPVDFRKPVQGLILNFELEGIDEFYSSNQHHGWELALGLRSEPWGQRHFIVKTPVEGLLIDFIEVIPPAPEFLENYEPGKSIADSGD